MKRGTCYTQVMGNTQLDSLNAAIPIPTDRVVDFCRKWDVCAFELYGPVLGRDFRDDDEVDVMVTFGPDARWTMVHWLQMQQELSGIFGRKSSLITRRTAEENQYPHRHQRMLAEARVVYAR